MPKRVDESPVPDLSYLPKEIQDKIWRVFNRYFNLVDKEYSRNEVISLTSFPNDVASLNASEVGNILSKYTATYEYINDKLKYLEVALSVLESEESAKLDEAKIKVQSKYGKTVTVEEKLSLAKQEPTVRAVVAYRLEIKNLVGMYQKDIVAVDKAISSLSREIARREHTW